MLMTIYFYQWMTKSFAIIFIFDQKNCRDAFIDDISNLKKYRFVSLIM